MRLEDEISQKEFSNNYQRGYINVLYTANWIQGHAKMFFKTYDLTPQQYNVLRILRGQKSEPVTINLLKDRMLDKMSDASRIVERLRLKELIARTTSKSDRRSVDIVITDKGLKLLKVIDKKIVYFEGLMSNLSDNEIATLNKLLDKLRG